MIAARYTQGGELAVVEVAEPTISTNELLVRVEATSICGTDLKIVRHGHRKLRAGQAITLGHEFLGVIEAVGSGVEGYRVGSRVGVVPNIGCGRCEMCLRAMGNMCPSYSAFGIDRDGSHAPLVRIPASAVAQGLVVPLPSDIRAEDATLAEPLSCVLNAASATRIDMGDRVVIYGAGPMGLLNVLVAKASGAAQVIAVDVNDERLEIARQCGAALAINSSAQDVASRIRRETDERGVDVVLLAAPAPKLQAEALSILAPFGRLCLFAGWPRGDASTPLDTNLVHYKSLTITGTTGGPPRDYLAALRMISEQMIDVSKVVSHVFPLDELAAAYDAALHGKALKVVLRAADAGSAA